MDYNYDMTTTRQQSTPLTASPSLTRCCLDDDYDSLAPAAPLFFSYFISPLCAALLTLGVERPCAGVVALSNDPSYSVNPAGQEEEEEDINKRIVILC